MEVARSRLLQNFDGARLNELHDGAELTSAARSAILEMCRMDLGRAVVAVKRREGGDAALLRPSPRSAIVAATKSF
jgi:hypothetical protein